MKLETKVALRVPEEWHHRAKAQAALRGITVSWLVRTAVDEWLERHPREEDRNAVYRRSHP